MRMQCQGAPDPAVQSQCMAAALEMYRPLRILQRFSSLAHDACTEAAHALHDKPPGTVCLVPAADVFLVAVRSPEGGVQVRSLPLQSIVEDGLEKALLKAVPEATALLSTDAELVPIADVLTVLNQIAAAQPPPVLDLLQCAEPQGQQCSGALNSGSPHRAAVMPCPATQAPRGTQPCADLLALAESARFGAPSPRELCHSPSSSMLDHFGQMLQRSPSAELGVLLGLNRDSDPIPREPYDGVPGQLSRVGSSNMPDCTEALYMQLSSSGAQPVDQDLLCKGALWNGDLVRPVPNGANAMAPDLADAAGDRLPRNFAKRARAEGRLAHMFDAANADDELPPPRRCSSRCSASLDSLQDFTPGGEGHDENMTGHDENMTGHDTAVRLSKVYESHDDADDVGRGCAHLPIANVHGSVCELLAALHRRGIAVEWDTTASNAHSVTHLLPSAGHNRAGAVSAATPAYTTPIVVARPATPGFMNHGAFSAVSAQRGVLALPTPFDNDGGAGDFGQLRAAPEPPALAPQPPQNAGSFRAVAHDRPPLEDDSFASRVTHLGVHQSLQSMLKLPREQLSPLCETLDTRGGRSQSPTACRANRNLSTERNGALPFASAMSKDSAPVSWDGAALEPGGASPFGTPGFQRDANNWPSGTLPLSSLGVMSAHTETLLPGTLGPLDSARSYADGANVLVTPRSHVASDKAAGGATLRTSTASTIPQVPPLTSPAFSLAAAPPFPQVPDVRKPCRAFFPLGADGHVPAGAVTAPPAALPPSRRSTQSMQQLVHELATPGHARMGSAPPSLGGHRPGAPSDVAHSHADALEGRLRGIAYGAAPMPLGDSGPRQSSSPCHSQIWAAIQLAQALDRDAADLDACTAQH